MTTSPVTSSVNRHAEYTTSSASSSSDGTAPSSSPLASRTTSSSLSSPFPTAESWIKRDSEMDSEIGWPYRAPPSSPLASRTTSSFPTSEHAMHIQFETKADSAYITRHIAAASDLDEEKRALRYCACLNGWLPECILELIESICVWASSLFNTAPATTALSSDHVHTSPPSSPHVHSAHVDRPPPPPLTPQQLDERNRTQLTTAIGARITAWDEWRAPQAFLCRVYIAARIECDEATTSPQPFSTSYVFRTPRDQFEVSMRAVERELLNTVESGGHIRRFTLYILDTLCDIQGDLFTTTSPHNRLYTYESGPTASWTSQDFNNYQEFQKVVDDTHPLHALRLHAGCLATIPPKATPTDRT